MSPKKVPKINFPMEGEDRKNFRILATRKNLAPMTSITGIGETVLDIVFKDDKPLAAVPGGSTFNAMISLGRTVGKRFPEIPIRMVSEVGDDHVADVITAFMKKNGVDSGRVTRRPGSQSHISMAFLDSDNNASYEFYKDHANTRLDPRTLDVEFQEEDIVLFGSYFPVNPVIRTETKALLEKAHGSGAILYYDINFRKSHLKERDVILPSIIENCALSDIVRGSSEDFGILYGTGDPVEIYSRYISPLCPTFILTCGSGPVHVFSPSLHLEFPTRKIETVSTIGAGDNFNAGIIYGLVGHRIPKKDIPSIGADLWKDLVGVAGRFSSNVCQSLFNYIGSIEELGI